MSKILIDRAVVEQALEALDEADLLMEHRQNIELRRSALVALRAALEQAQIQSGGIPPNWKLVPVEPNMSMTQSALNASRRWAECDAPLPRGQELWAAGVCWSAMLAAAPQPPGFFASHDMANHTCPQCDDGEGGCIYPHYGVAPHNCGWRLGHEAIGTSQQLPEFMWPENFQPDPETASEAGKYPGAGVYTHCPACGAPGERK